MSIINVYTPCTYAEANNDNCEWGHHIYNDPKSQENFSKPMENDIIEQEIKNIHVENHTLRAKVDSLEQETKSLHIKNQELHTEKDNLKQETLALQEEIQKLIRYKLSLLSQFRLKFQQQKVILSDKK